MGVPSIGVWSAVVSLVGDCMVVGVAGVAESGGLMVVGAVIVGHAARRVTKSVDTLDESVVLYVSLLS